jgi:hypothetical protein
MQFRTSTFPVDRCPRSAWPSSPSRRRAWSGVRSGTGADRGASERPPRSGAELVIGPFFMLGPGGRADVQPAPDPPARCFATVKKR